MSFLDEYFNFIMSNCNQFKFIFIGHYPTQYVINLSKTNVLIKTMYKARFRN